MRRPLALPPLEECAYLPGPTDPRGPGESLPDSGLAVARGTGAYLLPTFTVSRARPFRRRRDSVARPPLVFILARNPCLLTRLRLRGLYVGFITGCPMHGSSSSRNELGKIATGAENRQLGRVHGCGKARNICVPQGELTFPHRFSSFGAPRLGTGAPTTYQPHRTPFENAGPFRPHDPPRDTSLTGDGDTQDNASRDIVELTAPELWARVQEVVRASVPEQGYRTWLAGTRAVGLSGDELVVEAPSPFHVEWIEDKYGPILASACQRVLGRPLGVSIICAPELSPIPMPTLDLPTPEEKRARQREAQPGAPAAPRPRLNERYTFGRFVVGTNNQLAVAACRAVAEKPAKMYNPLFLYGGVGLGKTHLMHAIGHHLVEGDPRHRISYVSSEQFTNDMVMSIQQGTMAAFRRRYREMDLLLVDDIHFLEGKEGTQEEFFHTFNALYDAQRQIVLTSDRPPKEIPGLEERLVSRFEWGLVVDIKAPDYETRMAILRKKAADDGLTIDDEVIEFIAHSCTASVRELEGAVIKLLAYSSLTHQEITPNLARTALKGVLSRHETPVPSPERIQDLVARRWRVKPEALSSKRRTKDLTVPRQVAMYLIKETLGTSLVQIGEMFGGRDHSTVIHSIRKVEEEMARDPDFRKRVDEARAEVRAGSSRS